MKNIVIFGISGDLSQRYLIPALSQLATKKHHFNYFGFSRSKITTSKLSTFAKKFQYFTGEYTQTGLAELASHITADTIFYFSLPTSFSLISQIVLALKHHKLIDHRTKLVIEKPFGTNYRSAKELMDFLNQNVGQENVFLVDHYLTKDLVQNIIALRFANPIINQLWNYRHIAQINIIAIESDGIGSRSGYYDHVGALRDMIQNHCLQLLALTTMDQPQSFNESDFSNQKLAIINHLHLAKNHSKKFSIGQYRGYLQESGVDPNSTTETFAQINLQIDLPTWKSVPISLTTGKKMDQKLTEINIIFKNDQQSSLWPGKKHLLPNSLSINLTPDSDIFLSLNSSFQPHHDFPQPKKLHLGTLDFHSSSAYENVILDIINGVKINTPSFAEILAQWKFVDLLLSSINPDKDLFIY